MRKTDIPDPLETVIYLAGFVSLIAGAVLFLALLALALSLALWIAAILCFTGGLRCQWPLG